MTVEVTYPHLATKNDDSARLRRIPRIRVSQIVRSYRLCGSSADETCIQYPHLTLAEVHSAMTYYYDHQAEVDAEIEAEDKDTEEWTKHQMRRWWDRRLAGLTALQDRRDAGPTNSV